MVVTFLYPPAKSTQVNPKAIPRQPKSIQFNPKSTQANPKSTPRQPKSTGSQPQVNPKSTQVNPKLNRPQVIPSKPQVNPSQTKVNPKATQSTASQPKPAPRRPQVNPSPQQVNSKPTPKSAQACSSVCHWQQLRAVDRARTISRMRNDLDLTVPASGSTNLGKNYFFLPQMVWLPLGSTHIYIYICMYWISEKYLKCTGIVNRILLYIASHFGFVYAILAYTYIYIYM
jgi:hypothetical protein